MNSCTAVAVAFLTASLILPSAFAEAPADLDLVELSDLDLLLEDGDDGSQKTGESDSIFKDGKALDLSKKEEIDDLGSLKEDLGDIFFEEPAKKKVEATKKLEKVIGEEKEEVEATIVNKADDFKDEGQPLIFDTGKEEKELLKVSKYIETKIPPSQWDEIAAATKLDKYIVADGEWLWKISKNLFGSGFYYAKIWSLNPYITNPHEIEPGMTLVFNTGDSENMPKIALGSFEAEAVNKLDPTAQQKQNATERMLKSFTLWGDDVNPPWLLEKKQLQDDGVYVQYTSTETYADLIKASQSSLVNEYQQYEPPFEKSLVMGEKPAGYDKTGFDKDSILTSKFKEGFYLNTFVTKNPVQDVGFVHSSSKNAMVLSTKDRIYVKFDSDLKIGEGDLFSVYIADGKVEHESSDRNGFKYTISGSVKTLRRIGSLWECEIVQTTAPIQRKDRITVYSPKIDRIIKTYNQRTIEATILRGFEKWQSIFGFGDVVYVDRGRADGVELGNVFDIYSKRDKHTEKDITSYPTYKTGEMTVITLSDNFSTGLITHSTFEINNGNIMITKSAEDAARAARLRKGTLHKAGLIGKTLFEELDTELNLDDLNSSLLDKADGLKLSDDELEELERQERERSTLKDNERDLKALEKLESEIENAESIINEAKLDEDKLLEDQNLNVIEKKSGVKTAGNMTDVNDLESNLGKKYMDEDLNSKENPYGLTEFDLEEVDELLNTDVK